jgi:two-component system chemotaxis response regulator CheB
MKRDIVVIGGSAGSVEPVRELLCSLAEDVRAAIFIALHRPHLKRPDPLMRGDRLAWLLGRHIHMEVMVAVDGEAFEHGHVYIAPPQTHMLVEPGIIRIEPFATGQRLTSVDALFQSAAKAYGDRVIGVLLSGMLQDGTADCWAIRRRGGVTIAQDPNEAEYSSMPRTAMQEVPVDYCLRRSTGQGRCRKAGHCDHGRRPGRQDQRYGRGHAVMGTVSGPDHLPHRAC